MCTEGFELRMRVRHTTASLYLVLHIAFQRSTERAGNLEPWQIMKYGPNEKYTSHVDYYERDTRFFGNDVLRYGGQRIMTALVYLTTCEGGETVFKRATQPNRIGLDSCAQACAFVAAPQPSWPRLPLCRVLAPRPPSLSIPHWHRSRFAGVRASSR